jgi:hypothetical protein
MKLEGEFNGWEVSLITSLLISQFLSSARLGTGPVVSVADESGELWIQNKQGVRLSEASIPLPGGG